MEANRIGEIVQAVYAKAKRNCASQRKYALSRHVENQIDLSYKTIQRAFDLYINGKSDTGEPSEATVNMLCVFLGYENYAAYVNENGIDNAGKFLEKAKGVVEKKAGKKLNWRNTILISIVFTTILVTIILHDRSSENKSLSHAGECMVWSKTHYEKVACDKKYGTKAEPIDLVKLANFEKIEVTMATTFFDEATGQPLVWYYKTKEGGIEYFTAPGLHPITGKTLDEITPYMIKKYVPEHVFQPDSFIENEWIWR